MPYRDRLRHIARWTCEKKICNLTLRSDLLIALFPLRVAEGSSFCFCQTQWGDVYICQSNFLYQSPQSYFCWLSNMGVSQLLCIEMTSGQCISHYFCTSLQANPFNIEKPNRVSGYISLGFLFLRKAVQYQKTKDAGYVKIATPSPVNLKEAMGSILHANLHHSKGKMCCTELSMLQPLTVLWHCFGSQACLLNPVLALQEQKCFLRINECI